MDEFGASALGAGFEGFAKGLMDAEDRRYKRMEMEAKFKAQESDRERQLAEDTYKKRKDLADYAEKFNVPEGTTDITQLPVDPGGYRQSYLDMIQAKAAAAASADPFGLKQREAAQASKGFKLPPDKVLQVQQGAQIPTMLDDIDATLIQNKNIFGPVAGVVGSANPYDTKSQSVDAQFRAASQNFGRYMEGGVLRKEDEEKYRKMFPQLTDTPKVAENKLAIVRKLLVDKQNADVSALGTQGYDVSGFSQLPAAALPKGMGMIPKGMVKKPGLLSAPAAKPSQSNVPKPGAVLDGYRFKGGDPAKQENWEKVK